MKKRIISIMLAVIILVGSCGFTASAGNTEELVKIFNRLKEAVYNFSIGDTCRSIMEKTGYVDSHHILSPDGESVILTVDKLSDEINEVLKTVGKYKIEYQWYSIDENTMKADRIKGAVGETFRTAPFDEPDVDYYFYQIRVYKKLFSSYFLKYKFYSVPYVVGYTGLPTVIVNTRDGKYITSETEWIDGSEIQISGGAYSDFNLEPTAMRIKGRGNSSWNSSSKGGYTFKFEKKQNLFGIGKDKTWALIGNFADKSLLRNWFASVLDKNVYDSGKEFNVTQRHVDLIINGDYRGNFTLATTIRLGDSRVDVPDISDDITKDRNKDGVIDFYDAGFVLEIDNREKETYNFRTTHGIPFSLSDPDLDEYADTNEAIYQHIKKLVQNTENVLYSDGFADPDNGYAKYIDVDSFIDLYLLKELSKDIDGTFSLSMYMYFQPKDGKLHMASSWDFDIAFGNINSKNGCDDPEGFHCNAGWYARLLEDPAFAAKVATRWNETKVQLMDVIEKDLPAQADLIRTSAKLNFIKWPELGLLTWPQPVGFYTRWTYQSEVDYLTSWTLKRIDWLDGAYGEMLK